MGDLRHVPSGLGRLPSQSTIYGRTTFASYPPLPLDRDCEARVDPDITGTGPAPQGRGVGAYDIGVYALGPRYPCHPARYVPQYPMGD